MPSLIPLQGAALMLLLCASPLAAQTETPGDEPASVDVPKPEPRPQDDSASSDEPDEAAGEDEGPAEDADEDESEREGEPAYVSPDEARTSPEERAPETPDFDVTPQESVEAARAVEDARACEAELTARGARFTVSPSVSEGECGVLRPVSLTRTSSGVALGADTRMLCRTALAFDIWVTEGVVPAARETLGADAPSAIGEVSTYVCRDRARESGVSEHGRGSAIDVGAFAWEKRAPVAVEAQDAGSPEDRFLAAVRRAACGPFKTVLGPGTDADHADHLHLDIAARSNGSTYCR